MGFAAYFIDTEGNLMGLWGDRRTARLRQVVGLAAAEPSSVAASLEVRAVARLGSSHRCRAGDLEQEQVRLVAVLDREVDRELCRGDLCLGRSGYQPAVSLKIGVGVELLAPSVVESGCHEGDLGRDLTDESPVVADHQPGLAQRGVSRFRPGFGGRPGRRQLDGPAQQAHGLLAASAPVLLRRGPDRQCVRLARRTEGQHGRQQRDNRGD